MRWPGASLGNLPVQVARACELRVMNGPPKVAPSPLGKPATLNVYVSSSSSSANVAPRNRYAFRHPNGLVRIGITDRRGAFVEPLPWPSGSGNLEDLQTWAPPATGRIDAREQNAIVELRANKCPSRFLSACPTASECFKGGHNIDEGRRVQGFGMASDDAKLFVAGLSDSISEDIVRQISRQRADKSSA